MSKVLIKAINAAKTLRREQDLQWLESELLGYKKTDDKSIPKYRTIEAKLYIGYQNESGLTEVMDSPYPLRWAETLTRLEESLANNRNRGKILDTCHYLSYNYLHALTGRMRHFFVTESCS